MRVIGCITANLLGATIMLAAMYAYRAYPGWWRVYLVIAAVHAGTLIARYGNALLMN